MTTDAFRLTDGAIVNALTTNAENGGDITINANTFEAIDGGQVVTTTFDRGRAGNITLNVADRIQLSGRTETDRDFVSGLLANTADSSSGDGGNIFIDPRTVIISPHSAKTQLISPTKQSLRPSAAN